MHPWFRPRHRRLATLGACLAWLAFEAWTEPGSLWFWLTLGFAGYAGWLVLQPSEAFEAER
jgi:hypothetical protein